MIRVILVTLVYASCGWFGRLLLVEPENLASFWLPSGVILSALLLSPKRRWPWYLGGVFAANLAFNMATGAPLLASAGFGLANTAEPFVAAWLVDRAFGTPFQLHTLKRVVGFTALVAFVSIPATAFLGAAVPALAFGAPYWAVWRVWWIADALGVLLVVPIVLSWARVDRDTLRTFAGRRGAEAAALLVSMMVLAHVVFGTEAKGLSFLLPFPYVTFPFLLWAGVRFGLPGASVASLALALEAVWHTVHHLGPFSATGDSHSAQVLATQAFLGVTTLSALMLAAVIGEREQAEVALQRANEGLEVKVKERTRLLSESNQKLARSNSELEQFAYVASHDLREPIRAVGSMVQLLERAVKEHLDARSREYMTHIVEGVTRMQLLIDDLLALSRIGTREDRIQQVNAAHIMKDVLANLAIAIQESGATVTHEGLPSSLRCDPVQLTQVLQNLVGNAIKFRGAAPPKIHVKAEAKDGEWEFTVRDNGIGIEPQYFERIFVIFQRLHTRRAYPGSGIGLAICKKIVALHGGRIWVESEPGHGSAFHFTYPAPGAETVQGGRVGAAA